MNISTFESKVDLIYNFTKEISNDITQDGQVRGVLKIWDSGGNFY